MTLKTKVISKVQRDNYHYGNLSNAIKELAIKLVAEHGVDGFSIRQAAGILGVAPSAVYMSCCQFSTTVLESFSILNHCI